MLAQQTLDLTGLKCPLPALLTKRAVLRAKPADVIEIVCDDPLCHLDLPHMARQERFEILQEERSAAHFRLWLRR